MPTYPHPEAFTILTEAVTGQDGDGNDVTTPTEVPTTGAFAPSGSTELIQGESVVIDRDTIYLSDGAPTPGPGDKIRARGQVYLIDGTPGVFHNPYTGDEPGAVLRLERVT